MRGFFVLVPVVGVAVAMACSGTSNDSPGGAGHDGGGGSGGHVPDGGGGGPDGAGGGLDGAGGGSDADGTPSNPPSPFALDLGPTEIWGVACDATGASLLAGETGDLVDAPLAYLAKLDAKGSVVWKKTLGAGSYGDYNIAESVATDAAGDMVFAGYVKTQQDFGGASISGGFVAKWKSDGTLVFVKSLGQAAPNGVFVAPSGDVYAIGEFSGSADLGGGPVSSVHYSTYFVHYDANGNYLGSKTFGGGNVYGYTISVDAKGDIVMTGIFDGSADFGGGNIGGPPFEAGQEDGWIARLDPSGGYVNAKWLPKAALGGAYFDASGNVVIAGGFQGSLDLGGGTTLVSSAGGDMLLATLGPSLGVQWAKHFGDAQATALAPGLGGEIVVGGIVGGNADLGTGPLLADAGSSGPFVARFDATGKAVAATAGLASAYGFYMHGVAAPTQSEVVAGGWYAMSFLFGPASLTSEGGSHEGFVVRLAP